ncbi:MAG: hypothetical protein M3O86_03795, partial [Actinomycetota bacterium]|nr:hypothetical protein [Actinomycetota bacterium]
MDFDRFTRKAQETVQRALALAGSRGNPEIVPLHLLAALLEESEGVVYPALDRLGVAPATLRRATDAALAT